MVVTPAPPSQNCRGVEEQSFTETKSWSFCPGQTRQKACDPDFYCTQ